MKNIEKNENLNSNSNLNENEFSQISKLKKSFIFGFAGFMGNLATGMLYPLELIKIRLQGN